MSDKVSTNIWVHTIPVEGKGYTDDFCSEDQCEYTLVHNNPNYHVIPKGENIICQGSMMYNPNSHKIVDFDEYHVIKKSDVDGDFPSWSKFERIEWEDGKITYESHGDGEPENDPIFICIDGRHSKDVVETIRNALIAQSVCVRQIDIDNTQTDLCTAEDTQSDTDTLTIEDYKAVIEDHKRLVRELDYALNGEGASEQASLCDIVCQVKSDPDMVRIPRKVLEASIKPNDYIPTTTREKDLANYGYNKAINDVLNYKEGE